MNESKLIKNKNIFYVGCKNPDMRTFDISYKADRGSTYNSYVLLGAVNVLIDGVRKDFADEHISNIEKVVPLKDIDYIVVHHTEPDHSGSLSAILDMAPKAKIVSSRCASIFLKNILHKPFEWEEIRGDYSIDIGWDRLSLTLMPFLHWPDTSVSYLEKSKVLFSCDAFGAHYCPDEILNTPFSEVKPYSDYYLECILRPFKSKVRLALSKLENREIRIIAPSHGPVHYNPNEVIDFYKAWCKIPEIKFPKVLIIYSSTYGYTKNMADIVSDKLLENGVDVVMHEITRDNIELIRNEMEECHGLLVGTPTIAGDAPETVWRATCIIHNVEKKIQAAAAFGSYGWSGEACQLISQRLEGLKLPLFPYLRVKFLPDESTKNEIEDFATGFYEFLKAKNQGKKIGPPFSVQEYKTAAKGA